VCTSKNPKNFRNRTSGFIRLDDGRGILIDATPDLRQQAIKFEIDSIDAVLFTHKHSDHILGTDDLRSYNFVHGRRITCFGTDETLQGVERTFPYIFHPEPGYKGGMLAQLDLVRIAGVGTVEILGIPFQTFPLDHGDVTVTGFRIGNFGYATDCKKLSRKAWEVLRGVDTLLLDGLRYEDHFTHMTIPEAIECAALLGARQTYLIHTTHTVEYDEVSAKLPAGVALGFDGLRIAFP
jgi:phosphoribosyl 1,2-cyclic phosphate phosphodiesterase